MSAKVVHVGLYGSLTDTPTEDWPTVSPLDFLRSKVPEDKWHEVVSAYLESRMQDGLIAITEPKAPKRHTSNKLVKAIDSLIQMCMRVSNNGLSTHIAAAILLLQDALKERNISCLIPLPPSSLKS